MPVLFQQLRRPVLSFALFILIALTIVASSQSSNIWLYGGGAFTPDDEIRFEYYLDAAQEANLTVYRILNPDMVLELGGPRAFEGSEQLELRRINRYRINQNRSQRWGSVEVGRLPLGMYFVQLESGEQKRATLLLVTDLALVVKSDPETILTYTAEQASGTPRQASLYLMRGETLYAEGLASTEGLTEFAIDTTDELVVAARFGDAWAFTENYWSSWSLERNKVYLQTDRPVYRPGHTVFFKGTARAPGNLTPLIAQNVELRIRDADGKEILSSSFVTDDYGSFAGELILAAEPPLGSYSLEARVGGATSYSSFEVQAYQKPEYRVSVTAGDTVAVQGDTASFTVAAEYLFGGAVTGGQVSYVVMKQPYYRWRYTSRFGFYDEYSYAGYYGGEVLERGEGVLNERGELVVTVNLPQDRDDYQLTLQAGVTDEARREISASGSLIAYRAAISLDVRTDRYAYKTGDKVQVTVRAEDLQGNPVSVPFQLRSERYYWESGRGRQNNPEQRLQGVTGADGTAVLILEPSEQGSYDLVVTAQDSAGRSTQASRWLWVSGSSRWFWNYDSLSITVDKDEYELGDTARFVIQSPIADAFALITREGQKLASYDLVQLNGSVLTYELEISEDMTPNSYLSVVIIGNGTTYYETVGFRVPPVNKFLNVEITSNSDVYEPGETGVFNLRVSDSSGQGVRTQLTLALVDEGIYLIRPDATPDIRGFFYALKGNVVGTQLSSWYYFGEAEPIALEAAAPMAARAAMDEAVFGQAKSDFVDPTVREDFQDTILWLPTLETDDNGRATVTVEFPDNLTEWRLSTRAISATDLVGQNTYSVKTSLPVIARLAAPRFFIRKDEASLRVIGQSNLETDEPGQLELLAKNLRLDGVSTVPVIFPAGGRSTADFLVQAEMTGTALVTASARTGVASDAMRLPIPVLPHGLRSEIAWAGSGTDNWVFHLPDNLDANSVKGSLYLTPSLAAAVSPALAYLAGYPYGCTEQTMSRFYPSILAAQAGELARLPEDIAENLDDIVAKGLSRIYDFQHSDGGWGFWQYDAPSAFISAYVLSGLLDAQNAGYEVNGQVLERGLNYLESAVLRQIDSYRVVNADAKAYAYYALARAGRNISGLDSVVGKREMSAYGLALSVLAYSELGQTTLANLYLDELLSRITERSQVAYWETGGPRYYWNNDRIEATAYALEALVRLRPDEPRIGKIVNWLLLERQGARWVSTKDTAAVVKAALALAEASGEASADYRVAIMLDGTELLSTRIMGQAAEGIEINLPALAAGRHRLSLQVEGQGTLYASANISYVAEQDSFEPQRDHFEVERSYERLLPRFDETKATFSYERVPLTEAVAPGDYVLVTVSIDPKDSYRYVLVNEPLPAGYRVVEEDLAFRISGLTPRYGWDYFGWNYWYDGRDIRDERVDYYFTALGSEVSFTYILRAETPGSFTALPTQVWLMYEPEVRGTATAARLEIRGE